MREISYSLIFLLLFNCNSGTKDSLSYSSKPDIIAISIQNEGKKLMETNCYVCHSPLGSHDSRLAPPMEAIKRHYINDDTSKEEFVRAIQDWIKNPNKEDARMFGAVNRFGVMPKVSLPSDSIKLIAEYLYENDIEKPEWFDEHHSKNE